MRGEKNVDKPAGIVRNRTFMLLITCGVIAFLAVGANLFKIQVIEHSKYEAAAISQQTRDSTVRASRGTIFDRNGKVLAANAAAETVYIDPYLLALEGEDAEAIATKLAELLGVDRDEILKKYEDTSKSGLPIKRKIEADEAAPLRQYISENKIKSVYLTEDTKRYYPQSTLASNIIGFVGTDNYGLDGLEARYDKYLTGEDGRVVRLRNVSGTELWFSDYENYFEAKDGNDVMLTIDTSIQYYLEKHLTQAVADFNVLNGAAAIAMDPKTGEILGSVSLGNYDLNAPFDVSGEIREMLDMIEDPEERSAQLALARQTQWRNKAISDTYEPGSVFKTITLAVALEEGLIDEHSTFYCDGHMEVAGREPVKCWRIQGHGTQTLAEAVQNSCNVAFVNIGFRIGAERFYRYIEEFGFFDKTNIDLPGEAGSIWWTYEEFAHGLFKTELAAASFGQTFNITPIQLVTAISAAVNGGELYTPHVVKQITDNNGNVLFSGNNDPLRQVISSETSTIVRAMLESVVSEGTGANASVKGYRVGGKTGTSTNTVIQAETGGEVKQYTVSFCGVAPMDDPQIVILLLLDNPDPGPEIYVSGGGLAAPVVGNMLSDILPYLGVVPQYTEEEIMELNVTVPRLDGMYVEDVTAALDRLKLEYRFVGDGGTVTDQIPSAHAVVSPGTTVVVYMGEKKPDNEEVTVPDLTGKSYSEARRTLEAAGLFIRSIGASASTGGAVVSIQSTAVNSVVPYGSVIEVTLVDKSIQGIY